jgi:hypothetical protein
MVELTGFQRHEGGKTRKLAGWGWMAQGMGAEVVYSLACPTAIAPLPSHFHTPLQRPVDLSH